MSGPSKNDVTDIAINSCPQKSVQSPLPHTLHLVGALHVVDDPGRGPPHIPNGAGDLAGIAVFMGGTIECGSENLPSFLPAKQIESSIEVIFCHAMQMHGCSNDTFTRDICPRKHATPFQKDPPSTHQPVYLD